MLPYRPPEILMVTGPAFVGSPSTSTQLYCATERGSQGLRDSPVFSGKRLIRNDGSITLPPKIYIFDEYGVPVVASLRVSPLGVYSAC